MPMTIQIRHWDDEGNTVIHEFPAKNEVCWHCEGVGGFEEWDERALLEDHPNFCTCGECHGRRVVLVVDEDRLTEEQQTILTEVDAAERELAEESRLRAAGYQF